MSGRPAPELRERCRLCGAWVDDCLDARGNVMPHGSLKIIGTTCWGTGKPAAPWKVRAERAEARVAALEGALRTALQQWSGLWARYNWQTIDADNAEADRIESCRSVLADEREAGQG